MSDYFTQIAEAVSFGADRPAKADLFAGRQLFVGLNCFEPGQSPDGSRACGRGQVLSGRERAGQHDGGRRDA